MKYEISLSKFLSKYCNYTGKSLTKIHHEDVKVLFPNIKRVSFEELEENPDLIDTRKVIFVNDGVSLLPYYVPITKDDNLDCPLEIRIKIEETKITVDSEIHDYANMSIYELKCLLKRKFNSSLNQKKARMELTRRGVVLQKKYDRNYEKRKVRKIKNERN